MLTPAIEDYLKAVYKLGHSGDAVTTNAVAERLGVSPASVTNMMKKLARLELVDYTPYRGVQLTRDGRKIALLVTRRHRLLELYLVRRLGMGLDAVHQEADRLEHALSEELAERIARSMGEPTRDPHGDPIPTREGAVEDAWHPMLADLALGQRGVVTHVSDRDAAVLRALAARGLLPGARIQVLRVADDGSVSLKVGRTRRRVAPYLARAVRVDPASL